MSQAGGSVVLVSTRNVGVAVGDAYILRLQLRQCAAARVCTDLLCTWVRTINPTGVNLAQAARCHCSVQITLSPVLSAKALVV